jgi:hypothetical protein
MDEIPQTLNTSSVPEVPLSLSHSIVGNDRIVAVLYKKVEEMEKKIYDIETKKILDETQLPVELLEQNGLLPQRRTKLKCGSGYRPLLQSEIEEAKTHSVFAAAQARYLGVSHETYKKYAKMYGIYEPRPNEKGKRNLYSPSRGKYPLERILSGEFNGNPAVTNWMVRDKVIRGNIFPPKCNICGYDKRRIGDNKICILLDHKDGNTSNFIKDNLQLLCLNCTFECGRGYIRRGNHMYDLDPDVIEGNIERDIDKRARY